MVRKRVPTALIVPDASPLVTLGRVGRLDVLSLFTVPIHIVDVVLEEAQRSPNDTSGAVRRWWETRPNNVQEVSTLVGDGLRYRRSRGENPKTGGLGEIAVDEYASIVARTGRQDEIPLVLFEDPDILELSVTRLKNVHLMNTSALLLNLHRMDILRDGRDIVARINALRKTPMEPIDRPAKTSKHQSSLGGAVVKEGWGS